MPKLSADDRVSGAQWNELHTTENLKNRRPMRRCRVRCSRRPGPKGPSRELIQEIRTVPYLPLSHPFIERLIGTIRREFIHLMPFWNADDLERKLEDLRQHYNTHRVHISLARAG